MTERRLIGFWRNEEHPEYPSPEDLVDQTWDRDERDTVWWYLSHGTVPGGLLWGLLSGYSPCRLCGKHNGRLEYTDGVYQWPEGLAHYVDDHSVRLPAEFVEHAVRRLESLEEEPVSLDWWLAATASGDR